MSKNDNIAIYFRLSLDDEVKGESASITGQRELILNYLKENNELSNCSITEFLDDGFSGTNFNRPGVTKMLDSIKNGKISCVVVKDLSRFGRNYIEVGNYLERVFPFLNVRFISINDNYDSNNHKGSTGEIDITFRNLLYDLYSKDISRKILSSKKMKMKKGDFTSPYAPYGYFKDESNRNILVIDETAACVVRRIFNDALNGKKTGDIAKALNNEDVLTPMEYKKTLGISRAFNRGSSQNVWTTAAVRRILNDEQYTGKFIGGKLQNRIANDKKIVSVAKSEWIIVPNKHPQIVSEEIFLQANMIIKGRKKGAVSPNPNRLFSKKIKCKCCNLLFSRKDQISSFYFCPTSKVADKGCYKGKVYETDLANILLPIFQKHITIAIDFKEQIQKQNKIIAEEIKVAERELQKLRERLSKNENTDFELYEKYRAKKFSNDDFFRLKEVIHKAALEDTAKAGILSGEIVKKYKMLEKKLDITEICGVDDYITEVTRDMINRLIDKIVVDSNGNIEISFTYQDPTEVVLSMA